MRKGKGASSVEKCWLRQRQCLDPSVQDIASKRLLAFGYVIRIKNNTYLLTLTHITKTIHCFAALQVQRVINHYYSAPVGEWSIAMSLSVCLCVCLSANISLEPLYRFANFFLQIPCCHGSILLGQRCNMLCTSGFMNDVTFGRTVPYGNA